LLEISEWHEYMPGKVAERIRKALRLPLRKQKKLLQIFKDYQHEFSKITNGLRRSSEKKLTLKSRLFVYISSTVFEGITWRTPF